MTLKSAARVLIPILLAAFGTACSKDSATAPSTTTAGTETFSSALAPGGSTSHTFTVSKSGTISVTLTNVGAAANLVGLGIGIPNPNGSGCNLTTAVTTTAGASPQVSSAVDAGVYCVQIYDSGRLTDLVGFTMTITVP